MTEGNAIRFVQHWTTTDAIPLPAGWLNVYEYDGKHQTSPCPAMLRQEHRETYRRNADGSFSDVETEMPYDVRIVAAEFSDGQLDEVCDVSNYIGTFHESNVDRLS